MEKGYNLAKTAEFLGLKVRTVRQWIHDGRLRAEKPQGGKNWIVLESEIRRIQNGESRKE